MYERDKKQYRCRQVDNGIEDENGRERLNNLPARARGGMWPRASERATILLTRRPLSLARDVVSQTTQAPNR